jgi:hypothetical protein
VLLPHLLIEPGCCSTCRSRPRRGRRGGGKEGAGLPQSERASRRRTGTQGGAGAAACLAGVPTESDLAVEHGLSRAEQGGGRRSSSRREEVYRKLRDAGCCAVLARMRSSQPTKDDIQDTTLIRK